MRARSMMRPFGLFFNRPECVAQDIFLYSSGYIVEKCKIISLLLRCTRENAGGQHK